MKDEWLTSRDKLAEEQFSAHELKKRHLNVTTLSPLDYFSLKLAQHPMAGASLRLTGNLARVSHAHLH